MIPQSSYSLERSSMHGWLQISVVFVDYEGKNIDNVMSPLS